MTKKNIPDLRLFFALLSGLLILAAGTGCTRHHADNITQNTMKAKGKSLADSLTAVWKLDRIEIPNAQGNTASFGNQADRDKEAGIIAKYMDALKGMTATFSPDNTYQTVYNGNSDVGTWNVNSLRVIEAHSKVNGVSSFYQLISVTGSTLTVNYTSGDGALLMIFQKK